MMAANRRRGEVAANIDGRERILCLTLGALAQLESAFAVGDLTALAERFSSGRFSSNDLMQVLAAGLCGGGENSGVEDVASMTIDGGVAGFATVVAELLQITFGSDEQRQDP